MAFLCDDGYDFRNDDMITLVMDWITTYGVTTGHDDGTMDADYYRI